MNRRAHRDCAVVVWELNRNESLIEQLARLWEVFLTRTVYKLVQTLWRTILYTRHTEGKYKYIYMYIHIYTYMYMYSSGHKKVLVLDSFTIALMSYHD